MHQPAAPWILPPSLWKNVANSRPKRDENPVHRLVVSAFALRTLVRCECPKRILNTVTNHCYHCSIVHYCGRSVLVRNAFDEPMEGGVGVSIEKIAQLAWDLAGTEFPWQKNASRLRE